MKTDKLHIKHGLFITFLIFVSNIAILAQDVCNRENMLAGKTFEINEIIYSPGWKPSMNYASKLENGILTLHLKEATSASWQAQFFIDINPVVSLKTGEVYCISFDIETNVSLPQVLIKFFKDGNHNRYIEIKGTNISKGKQTISGTMYNTGLTSLIQVDKVLFDFGGNPTNAEIIISNITVRSNTSSTNNFLIEGMTVFPNPVKDVLYIHGLENNTRIRIIDTTGSIKIDQMINDEINISKLTQGLYFVVTGDKTFKIIKQ